MKTWAICVLLLACLGCVTSGQGSLTSGPGVVPQAGPPTVEVERDRFRGTTMVLFRNAAIFMSNNHRLDMTAYADPEVPGLSLLLSTSASGWEYLRCQNFAMLADGQPVSFEEAPEYEGRVISNGVVEHFSIRLSLGEAMRISEARAVEGRVCRDEWQLSPVQVAAIRQVLEMARDEALRMAPVQSVSDTQATTQ